MYASRFRIFTFRVFDSGGFEHNHFFFYWIFLLTVCMLLTDQNYNFQTK